MRKKLIVIIILFLSLPGFLGAALLPISSFDSWTKLSEMVHTPFDTDASDEETTPRANLLEEEIVEGLHHKSFLILDTAMIRLAPDYFSLLKEKIPSHHTLFVDEQPPNI